MNNNYIVYVHIFPNGKRYIGMTRTSLKKRWDSGHGYNGQLVHRAIKKYGWKNVKHKIINENLSQSNAEKLEKEMIQFYQTFNRENGYNIELGGNSQKEITKEIRRKISIANKGQKAWNKGLKLKDDEIKNNRYGSILQYDLDGNFIKEWRSISNVKKNIGLSPISCCKGTNHQAGGFQWRFKENNNFNKKIEPCSSFKIVKVRQYNLNHTLIKEWNSFVEIEKELGFDKRNIHACCKKNKDKNKNKKSISHNFIWTYKEKEVE